MSLRFVLTLHSHLPWVLNRERWPHGSDWICEAALDSYLPLVMTLQALEREGVSHPITLGITPILAAQFAHPSFRRELDIYFAHRLQTIAEAPDSLRATGDAHLIPLVEFWRQHVLRLQRTWEECGKDLIAVFRHHADAGRIELISSAATHGFLPLLGRDESIRFQLMVGRAEHLRHFGALPNGCWVPECAYRPAGPWQPSARAHRVALRPGIEEHLSFAGFRYFFVDAHIVDAGEMYDLYNGSPRQREVVEAARSPYRGYRVNDRPRTRPVDVLVRDPVATAQVWSRYGGYPGDGRYLEFHKIRQPGGLKFWAVTGNTVDLGAKEPYQPLPAHDAVEQHSKHFASLLADIAATAERGDVAIVAPFDTELFGHWWFEGMDFVEGMYRQVEQVRSLAPITACEVLEDAVPTETLRMSTGSWGKDGNFSMWMNPETEWTWERLWQLEERFWNAVPAALPRWSRRPILEQAARELLLAQSSDWQFIISTGAAGDYAIKRFNQHCDALDALLPYLEQEWVDEAAGHALAESHRAIDDPFPDLLGAIAAASDVTAPG